jgi:ATP-dependent DNA helicase RecG
MPLSLEAVKANPSALLELAEDQWFDRKGARASPRDIAKDLVAFANAEGGSIAIGVSKAEGLGGLAAYPKLENEIRQAAMNYTSPQVHHKSHLIPCLNQRGEADNILILEVEPSEQMHRLTDGTAYLRVGDETRSLNHEQAAFLGYDKGVSQFDKEIVSDATIEDFDQGAVRRYRDRLGSSLTVQDILKARGLFRVQGSVEGATWAGILLFGRIPSLFYPNAYVRIIQYQGTRPETGSRMNIVVDEIIEGPIPSVIDRTTERLGDLIKRFIRLGDDGRFGAVPEYPEVAWLEALINALTHRSYALQGDHIRIKLFDDRLEVESPGRLPGLVRLDNIRSTRYSRNPRIARVLAELGFVRELGEGVDRMFNEMSARGLPEPAFHQGDASFTVTLFNRRLSSEVRSLDAELPASTRRLVTLLLDRGQLTTAEAASILSIAPSTARRQFDYLRSRGLVDRISSGPNDPTSFWRARGAEPVGE